MNNIINKQIKDINSKYQVLKYYRDINLNPTIYEAKEINSTINRNVIIKRYIKVYY